MKLKLLSLVFISTLISTLSMAAASGDNTVPKAEPAKATVQTGKVSKTPLVDINSASQQQLMKLAGISKEDAEKIIAGRPYGSKTWLVGNNVLPEAKFLAIKDKIIAKQPYADAAKNAALYKNKK